MLPKSVADDMKAGRQVKPKAFNNITVFFSDIVDFSLITQKWQDQPTEIVRMLDKLYTLFDSITEQFDLYKVETIGAGELSLINLFLSSFRLYGCFRMPRAKRRCRGGLLCL